MVVAANFFDFFVALITLNHNNESVRNCLLWLQAEIEINASSVLFVASLSV